MDPTFAASWNYRNDPEHLSNLINHQNPEEIDWNAVIQRAESHKLEVKTAATCGFPFLHQILFLNPPVEAVRAAVRIHPYALIRCRDRNQGERINGAPAGVHTLQLSKVKPLQLAAHVLESPPDIVRAILQEAVRAANDNGRMSRIDLTKVLGGVYFWRVNFPLPYFRAFLEELPESICSRREIRSFITSKLQHDSNAWKKMNIAVLVVSNMNEWGDFHVLHGLLETIEGGKCDQGETVNQLLQIIKDNDPKQFRMRDDRGLLPLHIAIRHSLRASADPDSSTRSSLYLERSRCTPTSSIQFLVDEYPEAVGIPDENGRLPLHVAAEHGMPFVDVLASAGPRAVTTRSLETHFYPFQLVALSLDSTYSPADANKYAFTTLKGNRRLNNPALNEVKSVLGSGNYANETVARNVNKRALELLRSIGPDPNGIICKSIAILESENVNVREAKVVDATFALLRMAPEVIRSLTGT